MPMLPASASMPMLLASAFWHPNSQSGTGLGPLTPVTAKSQKLTYREWPNLRRYLTENGQILAYDKPELARPRHINYLDQKTLASQFS
jgi:hypothetical protein